MQRKIERMEGAEQSLFFDWLTAKYPEQLRRTGKEVA